MLNNKLILALLAASFAAAQEIERNDIPQDCRSICEPVLEISRRCDSDNDQTEGECICDVANSAAFATCNECTLRYPQYFIDTGDDDDDNEIDNDDNEVNVWYASCGFAANSTTSSGSITSAPTATPSMSTGVYTTTVCDDDAFEDDDDDDVCETRVMTGVVPVMATATTTGTSSTTLLTGTQTTQSSTATQTNTGSEENNDTDDANDNSNNNNNNDNNDNGAGSMAIPMLGAGIGAAFAALIAM